MTNKDYRDYLDDILNAIDETEDFTRRMTFKKFCDDRKTINAVIRSLEVLGEATKNIPAAIRAKYPEIPWRKMAGMRDKLIHEYFGVDEDILWKTVTEDLPPLQAELQNLL